MNEFIPLCRNCLSPLVNVEDKVTGVISPYLWSCPKGCIKDLKLSMG